MRSAPLLQLVMMPSSVLVLMASSADSMTAEGQYGAKSGLWSPANRSAERPPPGGGRLRGAREGGLERLRGRRWDAVVDTSGYVPRVVRASAELLSDAVEFYAFTSSMSVYADFREPNDEGSKLATLEDESVEEVT